VVNNITGAKKALPEYYPAALFSSIAVLLSDQVLL
jgi:hypothetical protein